MMPPIRRKIISRRPVAARLHRIGADVAAAVDPTVDLQVVVVQRLAQPSVGERDHERAVGGRGPGDANRCGAAVGPFGKWEWRHSRRGVRPPGAARRRRFRIGRGPFVTPFDLVIVHEALEKPIAQIGIQTVIIFIWGIRRLAVHRRLVARRTIRGLGRTYCNKPPGTASAKPIQPYFLMPLPHFRCAAAKRNARKSSQHFDFPAGLKKKLI